MKIRLWPRKETDMGGIIMMPLKDRIPYGKKSWLSVKCPKCGKRCWFNSDYKELAIKQNMRYMCTRCALEETQRRSDQC